MLFSYFRLFHKAKALLAHFSTVQKYRMNLDSTPTGFKRVITEEDIRLVEHSFTRTKDITDLPKIVVGEEPKLPVKGRRNILITSALPYVNNVPHLGTIVGCVLSADVYSRFCRSRGYNAIYICGTDEYGTATETKAIEEGLTPRQICDKYFKIHKATYDWFNIKFDYFGRTTTQQQTERAQDIFLKLLKNGYTFEESVDQLFCTSCQKFLADRFVEGICPNCAFEDARGDQCDRCGKLLNPTDLQSPRCKICRSSPILRSSNHIFLNLKRIEEDLKLHLDKQWSSDNCRWSTNAINISKSWLKDLKPRCLTRDLKWGTPVPLKGFEDKVFYVWFDAPIGYISMTAQYTADWEKWWKNPEEVELMHFLGKDNVVFHAIIFPSSLIGTGDQYGLVNTISATEFLNYEDTKFSKSRGVGVFGSDTLETGIPSDIWRFYLCYVRPETSDASFAWSDFVLRVNCELANNLGNFIMRALSFVKKFFNGVVPEISLNETDKQVLAEINADLKEYLIQLDNCRIRDALKCVLAISKTGNQYIQSSQPWALVKGSEEERKRAGTVVALASNVCALLSIMLQPYLPVTSEVINKQLDLAQLSDCLIPELMVQILPAGHVIGEVSPIFQLLDPAICEEFKKKYGGQRTDLCNGSVEKSESVKSAEKGVTKERNVAKKNVEMVKNPKTTCAENPSVAARNPLPSLSSDVSKNSSVLQDCVDKLTEKFNDVVLKLGADQEAELINEKVKLEARVTDLKKRLLNAEFKLDVAQYYDFAAIEKTADSPLDKESQKELNEKVCNGPTTALPKQPTKQEKAVKKDDTKASTDNASPLDEKFDVSRLDIRVGRIINVEKHPGADTLYVESVDVGEDKPRTVVSGLVKHVPIEEMRDRLVLLLCNLKPSKIRGVESQAMVMCASTPEKVELLCPPPSVLPGDRIIVPGYDGSPDAQLNPKKKTWEKIQPHLTVDASGLATFKGTPWRVADKGEVVAPRLRNVPIK